MQRIFIGLMVTWASLASAETVIATKIHDLDYPTDAESPILVFLENGQVVKYKAEHGKEILEKLAQAKESRVMLKFTVNQQQEILGIQTLNRPAPLKFY